MNTTLNTTPAFSPEAELQKYYDKDEWSAAALKHLTQKLCQWHSKASTIQRLCLELAQEISDEAIDYILMTNRED